MKKVLITGGAGFIGRHLCKLHLDEGDFVVCVDDLSSGARGNIAEFESHPNFRFVKHDVSVELDVHTKFDLIYHLASRASPPDYQEYPIHTMLANSYGTKNMLELALKNDAVMLYSSTSEVYGDPEVHPQQEDYWGKVNPIGVRSCYDESKRFSEALCMAYIRKRDAKVRIARIFNTYGPYMRAEDGRVVTNFINQALLGKEITVYGDGSQTRSFCYVDDLVKGLRLLIDSDHNGPVNLGNPNEMSVLEIAEKIKEMTGSKSKIVFKPLPKDDPVRRKPDISLAKKILKWEPKVGVEAGLRKTVEYFRE
ncbi:SDR family oxidoreductase [Candidatus Woesearchaeota archaeon]|nr:SDR family oxidoreductase [Candidatus Woesearchaeota archaeon]